MRIYAQLPRWYSGWLAAWVLGCAPIGELSPHLLDFILEEMTEHLTRGIVIEREDWVVVNKGDVWMQLSILLLLGIAAFIVTIASAMGKAPLWIAVLLINVAILIQSLPLR